MNSTEVHLSTVMSIIQPALETPTFYYIFSIVPISQKIVNFELAEEKRTSELLNRHKDTQLQKYISTLIK